MRRKTLLLAAAALAAVGIITGLILWISQPPYDETVKECQKALAKQYAEDGSGKPAACNDVKDDDYDALVLNAAMGDLGWLDDDGNFDKNKMLEDTLESQP